MPLHDPRSSGVPTLPDFLFIGAGKSGTTSIDQYLKKHPQIFMAPKEPSFFGLEGVTEIKLNKIKDVKYHFPQAVTNLEDYKKLFAKAAPGQVKGETSPLYFHNEKATYRIHELMPDAKLLVIFRQPVDRLFSRLLHLASENNAPSESFEDALDRNSIWWQRDDLVQEGFYHHHLQRYLSLFPRENMHIMFYEDFKAQPMKVLREIFTFLGVDPDFVPDTSITYNEHGFVKNKFYDKFIGRSSFLKLAVERTLPGLYVRIRENIGFRKTLNRIRRANLYKPTLDPELRRKMTNDIYKDDIMKLSQLVGRDLSHWFK